MSPLLGFTFNCTNNLGGAQPALHMQLVAAKGERKLLKYFPGFTSFMCVICVDMSHCVTTN